MRGISRREFGTLVIAGAPLAAAARPVSFGAAGPLTIGVTTSSFRELPRVTGRDNVDDIIAAIRAAGAAHVELALANVEPAPPSVAPFMGGTPAYPRIIVLTPDEIAATNARARAELRAWRLRTHSGIFDQARATLRNAGVTVLACAVSYNDSFTDEEIDATFRQVTALGVRTVSSPLTMAMARRLVPFAERHGVSVAIHNLADGNGDAAMTASDLRRALALSSVFTLKLDIGHITASNGDAVAELGELRARVSYLVVRDRLRNGGRSQPLGEGDTPIRGVLSFLRTAAPSIPAVVDYDYIGLRSSVDEVAASIAYLQTAG
jgi:sugar phosphate isomerase/epimerase